MPTTTNEALGTINAQDIFGEIERFAQTYGATTDRLLAALEVLSARKARLDAVDANLDLQVRKSAEISGERTTEKKIRSSVELSTDYQAAKAEVDAADAVVDRCKHALKTLDKKDRMLELLARALIKELGANARTQ
jgi:Fic family protein